MLKATPAELVFYHDMIFERDHTANWESIRRNKQRIIKSNNERENAKCIKYTYRAGDLVLYRRRDGRKHHRHYDGPYTVQQVNTNGTVQISRKNTTDTVNIRLIQPYHTK